MPGVNTHNFDTVNYVCPFFMSERKNMITCEGMARNSDNKTSFKRRADMEKFRQKYCFCYDYVNCHWARMLLEIKYAPKAASGR